MLLSKLEHANLIFNREFSVSRRTGFFSTAVLLFLAFLPSSRALDGDETKFLRYPNISNDGKIAFSYHGDIWVADQNGQNVRRLTAHIAHDTFPRFSPDGKSVAFNSDRMGNGDVWIVPVDGGVPRQITFSTGSESVLYWTPDGSGLVITASMGAGVWGSPLYIVSASGSVPQPMPMDKGATGMIRQDGKVVAFNRGGFSYWRKHYRGNNNTDIWVQDLTTKLITQLTDLDMKDYRNHKQDAFPMWGSDGLIYYMSEQDGTFNLWRIGADGSNPAQMTHHKTDGVQFPSISPDGTSIVYENEFEIWKFSVATSGTARIPVDMSFDPKQNQLQFSASNGQTDTIAPSPDGENLAVDHHGEIHLVPADRELGEQVQVTSSPWRDQNQVFSPDGKTLAYMSDQSGDEEIWLYDIETKQHRQLTKQASLKRSFTWDPKSERIAFVADNKLYFADVKSGDLSEIAHNPEGGYSGISFSSDGNWLSYSRSDKNLNSECYLLDLVNHKEFNVTDSRFAETDGELTPDGKHYAFASNRSGSFQLYLVPLEKMTEDPGDPLVKQRKAKLKDKKKPAGDSEKDAGGESKPDDAAKKEEGEETPGQETEKEEKPEAKPAETLTVNVDLDRIRDRARQLTTGAEDVRGFIMAHDGKSLYFTRGNTLNSVSIPDGEEKKVVDGSFAGLTMTQDGKSFFFRDGAAINKMSVSGSGKKKVDFAFRVRIDVAQEWEQVFEEAWRVMKYRFYDEKMHGYDWDAIKARYKPMLKYVGENQDLYDLCNEMIGELNASHTGVNGPPTQEMESLFSGKSLGFELASDGEYCRISHIYPKGPADREWLDLQPGDIVLEIEGTEIRANTNYFPILNNLLNDYADIVVSRPAQGADGDAVVLGERRHLRIRTISSVGGLKYDAWVDGNRKFVDEQSGGKVGYIHIRSMNQPSLEQFQTEVDQFWNKNGMIIDIRFNGGGNIDQQIIDILERKPYEYWNTRGGGRAQGRRPRQAIVGPQVMMINWRSASDSEVTPQAFRDLKLGTIVGNPTYGAVIATGSYRLLNGASIRTPGSLVVTYDPEQPHNYGLNLENYGVPPDVWVENSPDDELKGFDRELKTAVDEALRMLKEGNWQFGEDDSP